jgi:NAD+ kinase
MRVGIVTKHHLNAASETLLALEAWLAERRTPAVWSRDSADLMPAAAREIATREELPHRVDLVLVLGGDGTLLALAGIIGRSGCDVPILGVNFGSLGFLTEITRPELFASLEAVLNGRAAYDERMMLCGEVSKAGRSSETRVALNDIVFTRTALSRMIDLDITVGDQFVTSVKSDGLIVATPTGSTAYNLSAGGPIVHPAMDAIVLTPIAPHALTHRPIVIPAAREVRVCTASHSAGAETYLTFDGQYGCPLHADEEVRITRAPRPVRLISATTRNYFEVLRKKLKWFER